jgi:hypothetical protein
VIGSSGYLSEVSIKNFSQNRELNVGGALTGLDVADGILYMVTQSEPPSAKRVDIASWTKTHDVTYTGKYTGDSLIAIGDYIYIGTHVAEILKVKKSDLSLVGSLTGLAGNIMALAFDGTYLYAAAFSAPAKVHKIDLSTFSVVATVTAASGENYARGLSIYGDYLYLTDNERHLIQISISPFAYVRSLSFVKLGYPDAPVYQTLVIGEKLYGAMHRADPTTGKGNIVRVDLPSWDYDAYAYTAESGDCYLTSIVHHGNFLYSSGEVYAGHAAVYKFRVDPFEYVDKLYLSNINQTLPVALKVFSF